MILKAFVEEYKKAAKHKLFNTVMLLFFFFQLYVLLTGKLALISFLFIGLVAVLYHAKRGDTR